jgi:hypothetical protein
MPKEVPIWFVMLFAVFSLPAILIIAGKIMDI